MIAMDGEEGLKETREKKPDLIILDILMPKMDGYTFLRKLKRINNLDIPPVIILTSKGEMEETFRIEGVADYFVKPLEAEQFLKRIGECLA